MSEPGFAHIAATAARLFLAQGFKETSLRALASELGIQAASLYHHCPGGKAELYLRSVRQFLDGYAERLLASRGKAQFPESLLRMAAFTLGENHVDFRRVITADIPNLPDSAQKELSDCLHAALLGPLVQEFEAAKRLDKVRSRLDSHLAAACVLSITDSLGGLHLSGTPSARELEAAEDMVRSGVTLLLEGARP
jgi:AcrR family transcriptional regulator